MNWALPVTWSTGGAAALYTLTAVAHLSLIFRREYETLARWSTRAAWLVHSVGLILLVLQTGRFPVYSLFEVSLLMAWMLMTPYIAMEYMQANQAAGAFLTPVIAVVMTLSLALPYPGGEPYLGEQPDRLIVWHVGVTLLGYLFCLGSFVAGALYLIQDRNLRRKSFGPIYYMLPSLEVLDLTARRFVYVGFPLLTIGVAAGLSFAHVTFAAFWEVDPKVLFTLFIWGVYGVYLLVRKGWRWGGRRAAWWVVAGGVVLLFNYLVINRTSDFHRF